MIEDPIQIYADAFIARGRHDLGNRPVIQVAPGVRGVALTRLLVTDDSGYDRLVAELAGPWRGVVMVFERAERCNELLRSQPGWRGHAEMAMVLRDIGAANGVELPDGLYLRPVNLPATQSPDGVALEAAAAAMVASDPSVTDSLDQVTGFLKSLPESVRMFVAIDGEGVAHATAACDVFGEYAQVFFVSTEHAWRRRGIGQALTFEALKAAAAIGARKAFLHATTDGYTVYRRLGFEDCGMVARFESESA